MLLIKLFKAPSFSRKERILLDFLWESYLKYNTRYASFLYILMKQKPEETDYKLDLSNLKTKWINTIDSGIMGAFNPCFPSTIFICCNTTKAIELHLTKKEEWAQPAEPYVATEAVPMPTLRSMEEQRLGRLRLDLMWLFQVFPVVMHELYHMTQFKVSKIGYVAMRLVSVFTCIPYYLFQNAEWMSKFRKWFEWDIEGQAEKYGNNAPGMEDFCKNLEAAIHMLFWHDNQIQSINRTFKNGDYTLEEYEQTLSWLEEDEARQRQEYGPEIMTQAKHLYHLAHELNQEED